MSRADNMDTAPERRKRKESARDSRPLSENRSKPDESNLRVEKEAWVATPAPDFLIQSEPSYEKDQPASQVDVEPVTVQLTPEPAHAAKTRLRPPSPLASYAFYAALFVATAVASAAVVLLAL